MLKAIAIMVYMSMHGKKRLLFNHIRDSSGVTKVSADKFDYRHTSVVGVKVPTWVILTPKVVPPFDGIDMDTGFLIGFFGPTNKENAVGGKGSNYLMLELVERLKFEQKKAILTPTTIPSPQQLETTTIPQTLARSNSPPF